jgi:hypothetical protein
MSRKHFLAKKNRALLRALLKIANVFVNNSGTGRDISKIPTDLVGLKQAKSNFSE